MSDKPERIWYYVTYDNGVNIYSFEKIHSGSTEYIRADLAKPSEWISVDDRLPVIPEGRLGVSVLVAELDPVYAEVSGGDGYSVHEVLYGSTSDRDGRKNRWYEGTEIEFDFQTLYYGGGVDEWGPTGDKVTHWQPLPSPPTRETP